MRRGACGRLLTALLVLAGCGDSAGPAPPVRPNLVLIIGDDHGAPDSGFMGSPVARTPTLDRLAREGTVFRAGYTTASQCRASLRSVLTGLHPLQYQVRIDEIRRELEEQGVEPTPGLEVQRLRTLPRLLAEHGYASFQSGKHWEGTYRAAGFTHGMNESSMREGYAIVRETMEPVYGFIDEHREQPFFLWFAPALPHLPFDAPREYRDLYGGAGLQADLLGYFANVSWLDAGIGALVDHLEERGLRERTLLVYLSDNGWQAVARPSQMGGPRGKNSLYDPGFRTPILFNWPGRIAAGEVSDDLISVVDLFPTFLDYLGLPPLSGLPGENLRPVLESGAKPSREQVVAHMRRVRSRIPGGMRLSEGPAALGGFFIRTRNWRYILYESGRQELYELAVDPGEERNIAEQRPRVGHQLRRRIYAWSFEMKRRPGPTRRASRNP